MKIKILSLLLISILFSCEENNIDEYPKACFTYSYIAVPEADTIISFTNCSENANTYLWNFGDDSISTEINPKHQYSVGGIYVVKLTAYNNQYKDEFTDTVIYEMSVVYKPNIYIYPESEISLSVGLSFPEGGGIITSIPEYGSHWNVIIDSNGLINGTYNYLFYESTQPDIWHKEQGWSVAKDSLLYFFKKNMDAYNFSEDEIKDFTDYWIPLFNNNKYYNIFPQTNSIINRVIKFDFSQKPEFIGRLFYYIKGTDEFVEISHPKIKPFDRRNFFIMEWGVIKK